MIKFQRYLTTTTEFVVNLPKFNEFLKVYYQLLESAELSIDH